MKGSVGVPMQLVYITPKVNKLTYKVAIYNSLSEKAKTRLRAI